MPRKAKEEKKELNTDEIKQEKVVKKASSTNKKKSETVKKEKATASSKVNAKKKESNSASTKKTKSTSKSKVAKKDVRESKTSKKSSTKVAKKTDKTDKKTKSKKSSLTTVSTEYYDLPFRYNQTVVKILAQTPNTLFIYWDISDDDRQAYITKYGKDFFNNTRPYLRITNENMNYTFEVEINDFANSWYLHINDASCEYKVELIRKFIVNFEEVHTTQNTSDTSFSKLTPYHINDSIFITSSNEIEVPNNHILFDKLGNSVFFKNVKTNIVEEKNISSLSFIQRIGKIYNIYDLYKEIYKDELISDEFGLNLPSSNSSSSFK